MLEPDAPEIVKTIFSNKDYDIVGAYYSKKDKNITKASLIDQKGRVLSEFNLPQGLKRQFIARISCNYKEFQWFMDLNEKETRGDRIDWRLASISSLRILSKANRSSSNVRSFLITNPFGLIFLIMVLIFNNSVCIVSNMILQFGISCLISSARSSPEKIPFSS